MGPRNEAETAAPEQTAPECLFAPLPPELAFLADGAVEADALQRVAAAAQALGLRPEWVLLAEGLIPSERYYRLLARHLQLPFAERPLAVARDATLDDALHQGVLRLAPNRHGWTALAAPTGPLLRDLLREKRLPPGISGLALTTPERLEALIRQGRRGDIAQAASHGLTAWNRDLSAHGGLWRRQQLSLAALLTSIVVVAFIDPSACLELLALLFSLGFLLVCGVRIAAAAAAARAGEDPIPPLELSDRELPIYSIVVPLFREAREVGRLTDALMRLDYPPAKLDILLLIEANDRATLTALERLALPACFRTIMAPPGHPQTKPRALNVALPFARGAFLVVYDAEDDPEPGQLRAALAAFAARPDVACLQARLAIDNAEDAWLTRLFALEYAALFDVVNPGLAALRCPVPLGGTSNHFRIAVLRRVNGWDAFNVTEDIDLGIRLARFGHRVATLDSATFEEAPRRLGAWLAQRRRWQKGWMVTLATHSRAPLRTWSELGLLPGLSLWAVLLGTVASSVLGPFCLASLALRWWSGTLLHPRTPSELAWSMLSGLLLVAGCLAVIWPAFTGLRRRRRLRLMLWLPTLPIYLVLLSIASWHAAFEVVGRPYVWAKTEHGRARRRTRAPAVKP